MFTGVVRDTGLYYFNKNSRFMALLSALATFTDESLYAGRLRIFSFFYCDSI